MLKSLFEVEVKSGMSKIDIQKKFILFEIYCYQNIQDEELSAMHFI